MNAPEPFLLLTAAEHAAQGGDANGEVLALANDADVIEQATAIAKASRVELHFPSFTDGRAYSQAYLLRRRLGFRGDLRATGEVLADQLMLMQRTGFFQRGAGRGRRARGRAAPVGALPGLLPGRCQAGRALSARGGRRRGGGRDGAIRLTQAGRTVPAIALQPCPPIAGQEAGIGCPSRTAVPHSEVNMRSLSWPTPGTSTSVCVKSEGCRARR